MKKTVIIKYLIKKHSEGIRLEETAISATRRKIQKFINELVSDGATHLSVDTAN